MKRIFSFLLLIICYFSNAQTTEKTGYYYQGKKTSFSANYERLVISLIAGESLPSRIHQIALVLEVADTTLKQMADKRMLSSKIPKGFSTTRVKDRIASLGRLPFIRFVHPVFKSASGKDMGYGDELVVKLKTGTGITAFEDFVKKSNCTIVKKYAFADKIYVLSAGSVNNFDGLETANRFFESGLFEFAEPDLTLFDGLMAAPNDPQYNYQWSHNNTASAIQYGGTPGVDMKVQQAWNITKGAGIKIAVIDEGVDLTHPDLQANVLQGFDAVAGTANPGDGKPLSQYNGHGTSCAGIIAAVANNNIGVAGVAPDSKIIPINVVMSSGIFTSYAGIAAGFDYAWQSGADVISNSWGGGSPSSILDDAINRAVSLGRGGKGSVVLFASGNNNAAISYPSSNTNVICVGGVSMCGERKSPGTCDGESWWGANYGVGLDVVAPCVKVATTDIAGTGGYNAASGSDGNYFLTFNGTSSATPNAAGVAALILAADNNLTMSQARSILEGTCAKLPAYVYGSNADQPNGTWNTETGHGLIDAYSAVQLASASGPCNVQIGSPATFCPGTNITLSVLNPVAGTNYLWRKNGINLATGNSIVTSTSGSYDVVATLANGCISFSAPIVLPANCQVLLNNNDPVSICDALFFDSGGSTGNYGNNESFTKTFYPAAAGKLVQLQLDSFDIDNADFLNIYDGVGTTTLLAGLSNKSTIPQLFTSSTGALTVTLISNGSGTARGFFGKIGCHQSSVYRSKKTGAYSDISTWEVKSSSGFVNATALPLSIDDSIIIRTGHTVTVDQEIHETLDQVLVETGAVLRLTQFFSLHDGPGDDLLVNGTLELVGAAYLSIGYSGTTVRLNGDLIDVVTGTGIGGQKIDVAGNALQTLTLGIDLSSIKFSITNPAVNINLQNNLSINGIEINNNGKVNVNGAYTLLLRELTLTSGRMIIANNGLLNIMAPTQGTIIGGSESSFIEGPLRRNTGAQGADILFFPIGKDVYRPVWLNVTAPAGGFSSYQAQVFAGAPASRVLPASLNAVSNVRYYRLVNTGTQAPTAASILLTYGPDEGLPFDNSLRIAKDDGAGNWVDVGGTGGGNATGNVLSAVNLSSFGDFVLATAQNAIPGCTSNTTPADGTGISTSSTAVLGWNAVINATSYDVFIWTGASAPSLPTVTVTANSYNATGLSGSSTYHWYVRPKNASGYISTSCADNYTSFTTATGALLPTCAVNTSPANGTTLITQTTARLIWQASANATSYDVYLATGNAVPTVLVTNVTGLTYYAANLIPGTQYSWYVSPRNADGTNTACGTTNRTTFTTAAATGGANISPVSNAGSNTSVTLPVSTVTLDGSASYDPDGRIVEYYWYQIQGSPATISNPFSMTPTISGLTTACNYIIGLQVKDNNGVTAYAQATIMVAAADTGTVPTCITNTSPAAGATLATQQTATLTWPSSATAISYDVYLAAGTGTPATMVTNTTSLTYNASGLTANTLYSWYVAPRNASGANTACGLSNTTTFTTATAAALPSCVTNIIPANGLVLPTQTSARLSWPASAAAVSYEVYLSAGNAVPTLLATNTTALTYYATGLTPGTLYSWYIAPRNANGANTACGTTNRTTFTTAVATGGGNISPVSNAGSNTSITLPVNTVTLDGSASYDPDGRIAEFYWYQIQGPSATISNPFAMTPTITGLTTAGNYIIGLQVKDNNGVTAYSQITVTVNSAGTGQVPACVTGTSPAAGTTLTTQHTATLTWPSSATAISYDVYLAAGTGTPAMLVTNTTELTYTASGLTAGTLYSWYVAPRNASGANTACASSSTTTFITAADVTEPSCVTNISPANNSTIATQISATLTWSASPGATSYDVYFAPGTGAPTQPVFATSELSFSPEGITAGATYTWYIVPRNANGANTSCAVSSISRFTTAPPGNLPGFPNPGGDTTITLGSSARLDASASTGSIVQFYWYQISGPAGSIIVNQFSAVTSAILSSPGIYVFGLQVKDNNGVLKYAAKTVTVNPVGTAPACVTNTSPAAGATLATTQTATLTWPSSATAISYDVYLAAGTGTPTTLVTNTTSLTYNAGGLTANTLYSWYVAPRNASGANTACGLSNTTTFTTATAAALSACVINALPVAGSVLPSQTSARLSWPASAGATSYDVYLAAGNAVPTLLATNTTALTYYATSLTANTLYSWYIAPRNANGTNTACGTTNRTTFTTAVATGGGNISPVSNGGSNTSITLPVSNVTLDGSASYDPDGRIAEFYWYQIQAPVSVAISNPFSMTPTITGLSIAGNYIIGLQVKDNNGITAYSQITVTVKAAGTTVATTTGIQATNVAAEQTVASPTSLPVITGSISPNPVAPGRNARVQINSNKYGNVVINIVTSNGNIVSTRKLTLVSGVNTTSIGTISLAQGLYIINIAGGYKPLNLKLLVE